MRGVGQAGTVRRTTPVPPRPSWATAERSVTFREHEALSRLPDRHLSAALAAAGMSPFMVEITVADRKTVGAEWRIVQELRKTGDL